MRRTAPTCSECQSDKHWKTCTDKEVIDYFYECWSEQYAEDPDSVQRPSGRKVTMLYVCHNGEDSHECEHMMTAHAWTKLRRKEQRMTPAQHKQYIKELTDAGIE